jgi:AraC-like DNA-binding protein
MGTWLLKRLTVSRRWLFSYLIVLTVPLLLSIILYFFSRNIIFSASEEIQAATLEHIRLEVDNQITAFYRVLDHITVSANVQALTLIGKTLEPEDYFNIYKLVSELRNFQVIDSFLDDVLVVLNQANTVACINGHMSLDMYFELHLSGTDLSREEFAMLVKKPGARISFKTGDKLFFLQGLPLSNLGAGHVTVALVSRSSSFENRFLRNFVANGSIIYITDDSKRIISAGSVEDGQMVLDDLSENIQYQVLKNHSDLTSWDLYYLAPMELLNSRVRQIQGFGLGGFLLCLIFGVFFSIRMTRWNYGEYREVQTNLEDNIRILRKYYIYTLLEKPFDSEKDGEDMKLYSVQFSGNCFLVIFFSLFYQEPLCFEFIRTFQKTVSRYADIVMTDVGRYITAIINWPQTSGEIISLLEEDIEEVQRIISGLSVSAALSDPHKGIEGIYYANMEARETFRYLDGSGQTILHYRDVKYTGASYHYPLEIEQKLINLIRLGDQAKARSILRELFDANASNTAFQGQQAKLLVSDLIGTLMKGRLSPEIKYPAELPAEISLPEYMVKFLETAFDDLCSANRSFLEEKRSRDLGEKIKVYINENFKNPDLNISITAQHFNLTPAYLSGIFQQETGLNLLEYINTLRIEESKKLLEAGHNIIKTAELSGFRGSSTYIRIFRKITGITPGQYKSIS